MNNDHEMLTNAPLARTNTEAGTPTEEVVGKPWTMEPRSEHFAPPRRQGMDEASQVVLPDGYVLKRDRDVVLHPDHYCQEDGTGMWDKIDASLAEVAP